MKKICVFLFLIAVSCISFSAFSQKIEEGKATYYSKTCLNKTASGERLDPNKMTCAHKTHPFGTLLKVTNKKNGKSVVVKVNDRGPFGKGMIVDLSWGAAKELEMLRDGVVPVTVEVVTEDAVTTEQDN